MRSAAPVGLLVLSCGLETDGVDLPVAASTELVVQEVLRDHPGLPPVRPNAGASSTLARQIEQGAPADLFLSADAAWADAVAAQRPVLARVDLLSNTVVEVHADGARPCTAVADPDHVPSGRYAKRGLEARGQWPPADVVTFPTGPAAAWAVANGDCATGFVYGTDARAAGLEPSATLEVRAVYPLLLLSEDGRPVFEALTSETAHAVYARHGFGRP